MTKWINSKVVDSRPLENNVSNFKCSVSSGSQPSDDTPAAQDHPCPSIYAAYANNKAAFVDYYV